MLPVGEEFARVGFGLGADGDAAAAGVAEGRGEHGGDVGGGGEDVVVFAERGDGFVVSVEGVLAKWTAVVELRVDRLTLLAKSSDEAC